MYLFLQHIKYWGTLARVGFIPSRLKGSLSTKWMIDSWTQTACSKLFSPLCIDPSSLCLLEMPFDFWETRDAFFYFGISKHFRPPRYLQVRLYITLFGNITIWWISLYLLSKTWLYSTNWGHPWLTEYFSCTLTLLLVFKETRIEGQIRKNVLCFMHLSWNLGTQSVGYILLGWLFSAAQCLGSCFGLS